jgi:hypothetical protein
MLFMMNLLEGLGLESHRNVAQQLETTDTDCASRLRRRKEKPGWFARRFIWEASIAGSVFPLTLSI